MYICYIMSFKSNNVEYSWYVSVYKKETEIMRIMSR